MAEPVVIPVQLEVTDIDTSEFNPKNVEKDIGKAMSHITKSVENIFSGIDPSAVNKPIKSTMRAVEKSVTSVKTAYADYESAVRRAGASTKEYKQDAENAKWAVEGNATILNNIKDRYAQVQAQVADYTAQLEALGEQFDRDQSEETLEKWEAMYIRLEERKEALLSTEKELAAQERVLANAVEARAKIKPEDYTDKASVSYVESMAKAYRNLVGHIGTFNDKAIEFNETAKDNRLTDEYSEAQKQLDRYQKKLEDLEAKSVRMEALGATDMQWETMRYDVEQVGNEIENLVQQMEEMQRAGKALRFGGEMTPEEATLPKRSMWQMGVTADKITTRAKSNESPYTADYQAALDELDKLEKKMEAIRAKSAKMIELGASKKQFQSIAYDAEQLDVKVDEVKNHLMNMVNEGGAFKFDTGDADAEIQKVRDKSAGLQSELAGVATDAKEAQGGLTALGATHPKLAAVLGVAEKIAFGLGKVLKVAGKVAAAIAKGFVGAVKVLGKVASAIGKVASGFINVGKRIFGAIKNINLFGKSGSKTSTDMNKRFKKLTKNILMFGFGFRTAYYAIKRLRNIFIEGFKTMGDQFDEVGEPMKEMMESFNRLKGSLATAFQPLVSVVMPILTRAMNYLTKMLESVGEFTAALTGQGHIYKAVAKDIDSVSNSAKDANKQLGSYDKLEVIQSDNGNDTGYSYEKQELDATGAASNFANMVKEAWEKADFTGVGVFVTEKLLEVLDNVEMNIIPKVTGLVNKVLMSVNTFLTGFDATAIGDGVGSVFNALVNGVDWAQLGALFANINNTVWGFLDGLANGIDWASLGQSLATGISSMFSTLDLNSWVGMISGFTNGITTALLNLLTNVDWTTIAAQLGTAVTNLFVSIDTEQIGTTINTLFTTIWTFVGEFFATVDFETIATSIATGINSIFSGDSTAFNEAMPNVANGLVTFFTTAIEQINWEGILNTLLNGLQTMLSSLGEALKSSDNPLISAFGDVVLAINEVITIIRPVIADLIAALMPIIQSILPVISQLLPPIAELLARAAEMVLPVVVALFEALMPIISEVIDIILPIMLDLLESLQPIFDALVDVVLPVIVHALDACMPLVEGLLSLVGDLLAPLMSLLGPLLEIVFYILDPLIAILEPIMDILGTLCDVIGEVLRPILDALTPILDLVSSIMSLLGPIIEIVIFPLTQLADVFKFVAGIIEGIVVPILDILMGAVELVTEAVSWLFDGFKSAFDSIKDLMEDFWGVVKKPLNSVLGGIESFVNGLIKGINKAIGALNKLSFDVPDWVPLIGGESFGFNLKEISEVKIPRLAQGAVIPPNKEFLAMLGDQKSGTNIEAPLDTIKQALAEVLAEVGGANREPIILQVNGRTLAKVVWDEQEKHYKQTGRYSPA